ncbi:hypothetical protein Tcan_02801 [Toxocara canis]|uniref:COMM domain-containing protein n=1 Tax=Toxocara canis TaxID=6265 RepID=A0A0B2UXN3_TOXCA|nr:hypothetical protein Tcan_02801 [Toxocara canis]
METLEGVAYAFTVNVAGSDENRVGKTFVNLEFKTKDRQGNVKRHHVRVPIAEFTQFLQDLHKVSAHS